MKLVMRSKTATSEPLEKRFNRFAKALMAVPKKELDKQTNRGRQRNGKKPKPR
jgi:hypothetical protein